MSSTFDCHLHSLTIDALVSVQPLKRDSTSSKSSSADSLEEAEVAEVEMLLEAYDMHLEQALSRLQTLDE